MQTARIGEWGQKNPRAAKKASGRRKYGVRPRRFPKFLTAMQEGKRGWPPITRPYCRAEQVELPDDPEFEAQKRAFEKIPPENLAPYHGRFVAARDGQILDSDIDFIALDDRILERFGDVPIYITKIGERVKVNVPTIFLR